MGLQDVPQSPTEPSEELTTPAQQTSHPVHPVGNKKWVMWLVLWLGALPLGGLLVFVTHFIFAAPNDASVSTGRVFMNILSLLIGLYIFVGWIPMVLSLSRSKYGK